MNWTPHPVYPIPNREEAQAMAAEGALEDFYLKREELINLEKNDPFNYGSDWHNTKGLFTHWKDADKVLEDPKVDIVYIFGGNR